MEQQKDISDYVEVRFQNSERLQRLGSIVRSVKPDITRRASGNFHYARFIMAALEDGVLNEHELDILPPGIGEVYRAFFSCRFPDLREYRIVYAPLLATLVVAKDPVPVDLLRLSSQQPEETVDQLLKLSACLRFNPGQRTYQLTHETLARWLRDEERAGPYRIDDLDGHRVLANAGWKEYQNGLEGFSYYSLRNLPTHLTEMGRWDDLLALVRDSTINLHDRWIDNGWHDIALACLMRLRDHLRFHSSNEQAESDMCVRIAQIEMTRGHYDSAETEIAVALKRSTENPHVYTVALHEQGSLFLYRGLVEEAADSYRAALASARNMNPPHQREEGANLVALATVSLDQSNLVRALGYAREAVEVARTSEDRLHFVAARRLIAAIFRLMGRDEEMTSVLEPTIVLAQELHAFIEVVRLLTVRGWALYDRAVLGRVSSGEAAKSFHDALDVAERSQHFYGIVDSKISLAWCALHSRDAELARTFLREVSALDVERNFGLGVELRVLKASIKLQMGDWKTANQLYDEVIRSSADHGLSGWTVKALV